ncbi:MAG: radical SAM family heme chaperone HemW [Gemmatimonadales bacterium]|nr:radical SAM family heme chaperone HemW [Gemmatimonadales bacterium]
MHLYVHVPFCARRCSYCDFAIAVRPVVPSARYTALVLEEWRTWLSHPAWESSLSVETIYFGGGTPSRLDPTAVARIVEQVARDRAIAGDAEITLEANPDDVTAASAAAWRAAGVNRISLGVQSFDDSVLAWMHRAHGAVQAGQAVEILRGAGFENLSLDLIFGLPAALRRDWDADMARVLAHAPEHLSLYGLTIEPGTPLARWAARGEVRPVDESRYAAEFLDAHAALEAAGYAHYEVSNAALPGRCARHNSAYWHRAPFIGIGPGAHSGFGRERRWNLREWAAYARAIEAGEPPVAGSERLDDAAVRLEGAYLGLRTSEGLPAAAIPRALRSRWLADGWATESGTRLRLTPEGWLRLDSLVPAL